MSTPIMLVLLLVLPGPALGQLRKTSEPSDARDLLTMTPQQKKEAEIAAAGTAIAVATVGVACKFEHCLKKLKAMTKGGTTSTPKPKVVTQQTVFSDATVAPVATTVAPDESGSFPTWAWILLFAVIFASVVGAILVSQAIKTKHEKKKKRALRAHHDEDGAESPVQQQQQQQQYEPVQQAYSPPAQNMYAPTSPQNMYAASPYAQAQPMYAQPQAGYGAQPAFSAPVGTYAPLQYRQ